jgi:hypothetical protein
MTFSVLLVKDDQKRIGGIVWANDEANAQSLAPVVCQCAEGEKITLRRTEDFEIPFRLSTQSMHFS